MADDEKLEAQGTEEPEVAKEPEGPAGAQEAEQEPEGLTDKHGQPAIARGKYERDMAAKDAEIAELKAKVDEASKTEEGRKQMQEKIEKLRAEIASDMVNHALELAGCVNVKAARAVCALGGWSHSACAGLRCRARGRDLPACAGPCSRARGLGASGMRRPVLPYSGVGAIRHMPTRDSVLGSWDHPACAG